MLNTNLIFVHDFFPPKTVLNCDKTHCDVTLFSLVTIIIDIYILVFTLVTRRNLIDGYLCFHWYN